MAAVTSFHVKWRHGHRLESYDVVSEIPHGQSMRIYSKSSPANSSPSDLKRPSLVLVWRAWPQQEEEEQQDDIWDMESVPDPTLWRSKFRKFIGYLFFVYVGWKWMYFFLLFLGFSLQCIEKKNPWKYRWKKFVKIRYWSYFVYNTKFQCNTMLDRQARQTRRANFYTMVIIHYSLHTR